MRARLKGLCRGDGKLYAKVAVHPATGDLRVRAFAEGNEVPCGAYLLAADGETGCWALELPFADAPSIEARLASEGVRRRCASAMSARSGPPASTTGCGPACARPCAMSSSPIPMGATSCASSASWRGRTAGWSGASR